MQHKIIRRGKKNTRIQLSNGQQKLVATSTLSSASDRESFTSKPAEPHLTEVLMTDDRCHHSDVEILTHLRKLWEVYNKTRFNSELRLPHFKICNARRRLGYWAPNSRTLGLSKKLWHNAQWKHVEETILHEMAHQYVSDVLGLNRERHGPQWKAVARRLGISPSAMVSEEDVTSSQAERVARKQREAERVLLTKGGLRPPTWNLGQPIKYLSEEKWIDGVLVCPNDLSGNRWVVLHSGSLNSNSWMIIPRNWIFATNYVPPASLVFTAQKVKTIVINRQQRRASRRNLRKNWF